MNLSRKSFGQGASTGRRFVRKNKRLQLCSPSAGKKQSAGAVEKEAALNGLLTSLAGMPGGRAQTHQSVRFEVTAIEQAMDSIKRLQGTGALTIHFADGKPNGLAEWKASVKP